MYKHLKIIIINYHDKYEKIIYIKYLKIITQIIGTKDLNEEFKNTISVYKHRDFSLQEAFLQIKLLENLDKC